MRCKRLLLFKGLLPFLVTQLVACGYDQDGDTLRRYDRGTVRTYERAIFSGELGEGNILLVIDNSPSMLPRLFFLEKMVTQLVEILNYEEVRVGVITSSLGGHGSGVCSRDDTDHHYDDRAHLLPSVRAQLEGDEEYGFVTYERRGDLDEFRERLHAQLEAVGTRGCEFKAPLEAAYRFLVDPEPPEQVVVNAAGHTESVGVDEELLAQREAFLFPQGRVVVVMATDEDDCSVMDGGSYYTRAEYGHLALDPDVVFREPSRTCSENPNDECCFSCGADVPSNCDAAECRRAGFVPRYEDRHPLRCFDQKRRFGIDLLYPASRYVNGFTQAKVLSARSGKAFDNPLLRGAGQNAGQDRSQQKVVVVGLVGVPHLDVTDWSGQLLSSYDLRLPRGLPPDRFTGWDLVLGKPGRDAALRECGGKNPAEDCGVAPVPPADPFMIQSVAPRPDAMMHPLASERILGPDSSHWNSINGHEVDTLVSWPEFYPDNAPLADRLQFSSMGFLPSPEPCAFGDGQCPCAIPEMKSPLCQRGPGAEYETIQYQTGAFPAPRILTVLRDLWEQGFVAPVIAEPWAAYIDFGYDSILRQLRNLAVSDPLRTWCSPRLPTESDGSASCVVVEARRDSQRPLDCTAAGRGEISETVRAATEAFLVRLSLCGKKSDCDEYMMCTIDQLRGESAPACIEHAGDLQTSTESGYCFGYDSGGLCPASKPGLFKFVGEDTPLRGTSLLFLCQGEVVTPDGVPAPPSPPDFP